MSLREKLNKAQEDTFQKRKAADLAIIDKEMASIAQGLTAALEKTIDTVRQGNDPPASLNYAAKCKVIGATDITQADFEAMAGFNALVAACRSPDNDVELHISVDKHGPRQPLTARVERLAKVKISISPSIPYGRYSSLELEPYVNAPTMRIDITTYVPPSSGAAPTAPAPEEPDAEKIAVMAPLKLKG